MFRRPAPLSLTHKLDDFDCGKPELNIYLTERAMGNQEEGYTRTYVIADRDQSVVGYCSLCGSMISRNLVPRQIAGHGAPNDIPVVLLARLAVDKNHWGMKLGADLLKHAFLMTMLSADRIGVRAMLVHAKDDEAIGFYKKYKFRTAKGLERAMLCSTKEIAASLKASGLDR
ncbi:GNAT family N-acetyltransferase [Rhizobium sp. LjRoot254]|uniref:GNAT family N-acetyltransferase n=1 Tax=Rhizobium sp. LjRoot254 TaxID=3342297 RepID=UPI003ED0CE4A